MTVTVERMLPLYEGKMGKQYDHRDADAGTEYHSEVEQFLKQGVTR